MITHVEYVDTDGHVYVEPLATLVMEHNPGQRRWICGRFVTQAEYDRVLAVLSDRLWRMPK